MSLLASEQLRKSNLSLLQLAFLPAKLLCLGLIFATGCISIVYSQFLAKVFVKDERLRQEVIDFTKKNFIILLTFMTSVFSSASVLSLSFGSDDLLKRSIVTNGNNKGRLTLDQSAIIIANHQIYSDWLYLWFIAYLNNCHDHIFIIMKESLKKLPILGYGMKNYNFVFLSRKWENDQLYMKAQFDKICSLSSKIWMLIFPEGTNINNEHVKKSQNYAQEIGAPILKTVLLPRVKGLYLGLKELVPRTSKILDFTIGYSDHSIDEQAQDIFTLWKVYIEGESPKKISVLVNEYDMKKETPGIDLLSLQPERTSEQEEQEMNILSEWIFKKWELKEKEMKYYYEHGDFGRPTVDIPLKLSHPFELLLVYVIPLFSFLVTYLVYKLWRYLTNELLGFI